MTSASTTIREKFLRLWRNQDTNPQPEVPEEVRPLWDKRPENPELHGVVALGAALRRMK